MQQRREMTGSDGCEIKYEPKKLTATIGEGVVEGVIEGAVVAVVVAFTEVGKGQEFPQQQSRCAKVVGALSSHMTGVVEPLAR